MPSIFPNEIFFNSKKMSKEPKNALQTKNTGKYLMTFYVKLLKYF